MTALLDTGFLLAMLAHNDPLHESCKAVMLQERTPLIPSPVLPEFAYMAIRDLGYDRFIQFMQAVTQADSQIVFAVQEDYTRAIQVVEQYADSRIDFVDCMIVAMAERLNISRILTIDQRHFRMFRPKHIDVFEIFPA